MAFWLPLIAGGSVVAGVGSYLFGEDATEQAIETSIEAVADGVTVVMEATVPALMDGTLGGIEAIIDSFKGREVALFTGITVATLTYVAFRSIKQMTAVPIGTS